eukprot:7420303-Heterocapsa_arctica.AAC.1
MRKRGRPRPRLDLRPSADQFLRRRRPEAGGESDIKVPSARTRAGLVSVVIDDIAVRDHMTEN